MKMLRVVTRTLTCWIGALTLVNILGAIRHPGFDENLWWVDLRILPGGLEHLLLAGAGLLLLAWGLRPAADGRRRAATLWALGLMMLAALANSVSFWRAWASGAIDPLLPVPLSLLLLAMFAALAWAVSLPAPVQGARPWPAAGIAVATSIAFLLAVPLAQFVFFGTTDYRRDAEAVVVFGAKVNPPGVPSKSLGDRMATAVELYDQGYVGLIIVSGGVEPTGYDEAAIMQRYATEHGVPADAVVVDSEGDSTDATVRNTTALLVKLGLHRSWS